MPALLVFVVAVAAIVLAARPPVERALAVVIAVTLLVPDTLVVPGFPVSSAFVLRRLVLWSFAGGLAIRLLSGRLPLQRTRFFRSHLLLALFCLVTVVVGVGLSEDLSAATSAGTMLLYLDQLVAFTATAVALQHAARPGRLLTWVALTVVVAALIALSERSSDTSFAGWWFEHLPGQRGRFFLGLEERDGDVRVRGAFQFALGYGWTAAMMLPFVAAAAWRSRGLRRAVWAAGVVAVLLSVSATVARSTVAGVALGLVVLGLTGRSRRIALGVVAAAMVTLALVPVDPFAPGFGGTGETRDSLDTRVLKLATAADAAAEEPYLGLGLGAVRDLGFLGLDASYAIVYLTLGIVGLALFAVLIVSVLLECSAGAIRAPPGPHHRLASGALAAVAVGTVGGAAFDLFSLPAAYTPFWIAAGMAVSGRVMARAHEVDDTAPDRATQPSSGSPRAAVARAALVGLALVGGTILTSVAPSHVSLSFRFETLPVSRIAPAVGQSDFAGKVLVGSGCERVAEVEERRDDVQAYCAVVSQPGGIGEVRLSAPDRATLTAVADELATDLNEHLPHGARFFVSEELRTGQPTVLRTAFLWLPVVVVVGALLIPTLSILGPSRRAEEAIGQRSPALGKDPGRSAAGTVPTPPTRREPPVDDTVR